MRQRRGVSVLEVVIALALLAVGVMFILAIVPTGLSALKRSEDIQAAVAYGNDIIERTRTSLPPEGSITYKVTMNGTDFEMTRQVFRVNGRCTDVVVTARWSPTIPPRVLATRVNGQPRRATP